MKGGTFKIAKRHSKANNKYIKSYDVNEPTKFIMYVDANSLYGWTMIQYLPYGEFKWLNQKEIHKFDVNSIGENSSDWYILEVDLEYPDEIHELHKDYPLAPEKFEIRQNILSNYFNSIANYYAIKIGAVNKILPTLGN